MASTSEKPTGLWPGAAALLLLGAAVRALFLIYPILNSDVAVVGLMGMHAQHGELTPLYWGQDYGGSLEAMTAALLFSMFGVSPQALNAAPLLYSLVYLVMVLLLGREFLGRRGALAALSLAALGPYYLLWYSTSARGLHAELLALGGLLLLLTLRLLKAAPGSRRYLGLSLAWGLVAGVGMWTNLLLAFILAPALLLLWRAHPRLPFSRAGLLILAGFLVGVSPLIYYNLAHNWGTLEFILKEKPNSGFWPNLAILAKQGLPVLLGAQQDYTYAWVVPGLSQAVLGLTGLAAALAGVAWGRSLWHRVLGQKGSDGSELMLLSLLSIVVLYSFLGGADLASHRYLLSLYLVLPLMLAWAFELGCRRGGWARTAAWLGLAALLASNLTGAVASSPVFNQAAREQYQEQGQTARQIIGFCQERGLRYVYCPNYWLGPLWTFLAQEEVIFVQPYGDRHPAYLDALLQAGRAAWLVHESEAGQTRYTLRALGAGFKEQELAGQFRAFWEITPPAEHPVPLDPVGFSAQAWPNPGEAALAWDGQANTRWTTNQLQARGQWLEIDLGRTVDGICQIMLFSGRVEDRPQALLVQGSLDGQDWQSLAALKPRLLPAFWTGGVPLLDPLTPWEEIRFPPRSLRHLRLSQTGEAEDSYWSVLELLVGVQGPGPGQIPDLEAAAAWLAEVLPGRQALWCEPALAARLPARLRARPSPAVAPPGLPAFLSPEMLLPEGPQAHFALRAELLEPALQALQAAGWQARVQTRHGVALVKAEAPTAPHGRLYWSGLLPLALEP